MTWTQRGFVDTYTIEINATEASSVSMDIIGILNGWVSATVQKLPTLGGFYCFAVTAVRHTFHSHDQATLCNYTGEYMGL